MNLHISKWGAAGIVLITMIIGIVIGYGFAGRNEILPVKNDYTNLENKVNELTQKNLQLIAQRDSVREVIATLNSKRNEIEIRYRDRFQLPFDTTDVGARKAYLTNRYGYLFAGAGS